MTARLVEMGADNMTDEATTTQPSPLISPQRPQTTFEKAMAELESFKVLGEVELEMLEPYCS